MHRSSQRKDCVNIQILPEQLINPGLLQVLGSRKISSLVSLGIFNLEVQDTVLGPVLDAHLKLVPKFQAEAISASIVVHVVAETATWPQWKTTDTPSERF